MDNIEWNFVMFGALILLCVVIVIIACFHAVWLIRVFYSLLTKQPMPAKPFSKKSKIEST